MKVYRKRMGDIGKGEIVAGDHQSWWKITHVDHDANRTVVLTGVCTGTGKKGVLWGNERDVRDLAG